NALNNSEDKTEFFDANLPRLKEALSGIYESYNFSADSAIFIKMLSDASNLSDSQSVTAVSSRFNNSKNAHQKDNGPASKSIQKFAEKTLSKSKLKNRDFVFNNLLKSSSTLLKYTDELMQFQSELQAQTANLAPEQDRREGVLNKLMGDYVAVKEQFQKRNFIPDANSTLRLTYGYIRGYSPADATYMSPFTTIRGIIEKGTLGDNPDFVYPSIIRETWEAKNFGPYAIKELDDVPVNLLYNMDTTGGNSGSPIMNAKGELIGVNFD